MAFYTYIMASKRNGTLYIGHTDDLGKRAYVHREHQRKGFTDQYNVAHLVWYEVHETRGNAFRRERRLKEWPRKWKLDLIEAANPDWDDLYATLVPF